MDTRFLRIARIPPATPRHVCAGSQPSRASELSALSDLARLPILAVSADPRHGVFIEPASRRSIEDQRSP